MEKITNTIATMKKLLFLFILMLLPILASATDVKINETTFPDSNFRNWVLSQEYGSDGVLTDEELKNVTSLNISRLDIHDQKGIEYFTALKELNCMTNKLTTLDLSKNTALERLECRGNRLTTINLLENRKLRCLNCGGISYGNQITSLDVSRCTELDTLTCSGNPLTSLDVSKNTKLICLECYDSQLTSLDLSKNTALRRLHCNNNQLTTLDLSNNTELDLLQCSNNLLTTLDVTKNSALTYLTCMHNKLTTLCISNNKSLEEIICFDNQLTTLDVSGCSALRTLSCTDNQLATLYMSGCSALEELLCNDNQFTTLDLSENTMLNRLYCSHNQIKGAGMDALIESLPIVSKGSLYVMYFMNEQNEMTTTQVAAAKAKGWTPYISTFDHPTEYAGSETTQDDYRPFVEEDKVWTYQYYNDMTGKSYNVTRVVDGDIIIGGLAYKKICDNVGGQYLYALREEGKKVYIVYPHYETASLLYDFSKNAGDVINELEYPLIVASVDTIDIDGVKFRRMRVQDADKPVKEWNDDLIYLYNFWIEGVGSESLLEASIREPGNNYNLLSCKINGRVYTQHELLGIASKPTPQNDYRPFVEEDKVWKVGTIPTDLGIPVQIVDYYYFDGDTIIGGKTCKQMMCQRFTSPDYPYYDYLSHPNSLNYVGAWYEENQKVYFYDERKQSMVLKYDFSLGDYETLDFLNVDGYPPFIIGPKQTGGIEGFKGVYRDIMMGQDIRNTTWLEGIGSLDAPFRNAYDPRADRVPEFLMACKAGDEVIYFNDRYEDGATPAGARKNRFDFTHTTKIQPKTRISRGEEQSLYGEYNNQQLDINLDPLDEAYHVSITNESGQAIYEKNINAGNIVGLNIDISAYAKGRYTVTIENSSESFTGEFEAQTTGINAITINKEERNNYIYNLQGQRISTLQKGLNIVNGRKIFVK
jgi:hypothetical protein